MKTKAATWMVAFVFLRKPPPNLPEGRRSYPDGIFHTSRYLQSTIYKVQACPLFFVLIHVVLCPLFFVLIYVVLCPLFFVLIYIVLCSLYLSTLSFVLSPLYLSSRMP